MKLPYIKDIPLLATLPSSTINVLDYLSKEEKLELTKLLDFNVASQESLSINEIKIQASLLCELKSLTHPPSDDLYIIKLELESSIANLAKVIDEESKEGCGTSLQAKESFEGWHNLMLL